MAAMAELRSPAVAVLSERVSEIPPAGAGCRRPAGRERMPAGSANGLLVRAACTKAERRKERGGHSATAPARFELWSAIVTPNKVAPAVRKVLARFPGKAAPAGIARKTWWNGPAQFPEQAFERRVIGTK
jgi:hypothetical protein